MKKLIVAVTALTLAGLGVTDGRVVDDRRLREIVIEQQPMVGSMARTRFWAWRDHLRHFKPEEVYYSWVKYLDLGPEGEPAPAAVARR